MLGHVLPGGFFADANPEFGLFNLPFLVDDWDQALRLVNSDSTKASNRMAAMNNRPVRITRFSLMRSWKP